MSLKLRTTLSESQLRHIAKGLERAAEARADDKTPPLANKAERELMSALDDSFTLMLDSLQLDAAKILTE